MPHIWRSSTEFYFAEKMKRILLEFWRKITSNISIWDPTLRKIKACNFSNPYNTNCNVRRGLASLWIISSSIWVRITTQTHYVQFSQFYWHFWANLVMYICSMLQVCIIAIWSQGLILNSGRSYTTFCTKIPVYRANSVPFGHKMAKTIDLQKCQ